MNECLWQNEKKKCSEQNDKYIIFSLDDGSI